ncbi:MAG: TRAM domain-containing protein [Planctomycetota bacterium]
MIVLYILRGVFILLAAAVSALYLLSNQIGARVDFTQSALILVCSVGLAALVIGIDVTQRHKRLSAVSGVFLGLIAGLVAAFALSFVVDLAVLIIGPELPFAVDIDRGLLSEAEAAQLDRYVAFQNLAEGVKVVIGLTTCYIAISLVLQTKDDFRFVIPYVEFAKEIRGNRPTLLDTSVIIDGRIVDLIETRVLQGSFIVPRFVLDELQNVADSADKLKRSRGRRGLDVLGKLQHGHFVDFRIEEREVEGTGVDQKLLVLADQLQARVMTNDYNLNKVAEVRGVDVVNLNDVAKAMRPIVLPGEHMTVKIVKPGESATQGVGYLDDGTMVVVENGRDRMDQQVDITVTSTLQTSAGRMIFGRFELASAAGSGIHRAQREEAAEPTDGAPPASPPAQASSTGNDASGVRPTPAGRATSRRNPRRG